MLLAAALLAAVAAIVVAGAALRQASRAKRELATARGRLARIDAEMPTMDLQPAISATALRRDVRVSFEVSAARADRAVIVQLLMDFRDVAGAEEAIYWRWMPERDALAPAVWSSEATRPSFFSITEWAPLVQWSAEGGVVHRRQRMVAHAGFRQQHVADKKIAFENRPSILRKSGTEQGEVGTQGVEQ